MQPTANARTRTVGFRLRAILLALLACVSLTARPVSYKNPLARALPVTDVAFVPRDKSAEERAKTDKSWQRAVARGWTIRTVPGHHVAQQEDPRVVASLIEDSVRDQNQPVVAASK